MTRSAAGSPKTRFATSLALCLGVVLLIGGVATPTARPAPGDVSLFPLPSGQAPSYVAGGADGNVWFTITGFTAPAGGVGKVTPSGAVTEFSVPSPLNTPYNITAGPDGNVWFTEIFGGKIGRVTPSGTITEFTVGGQPTGITVGPDGNLWFVDMGLSSLRSITTSGVLGVQFGGLNNPREVVTGSDGNLWVSEFNGGTITRVTPFGSMTRFPLPPGSFFPQGVALGPDGNVWFTASDMIGKITPSGTITRFTPPTEASSPFDITAGADGNLWFTERNTGKIGRITPGGVITEFATPAEPGALSGIASGPDRNIWFAVAGFTARGMGRIELELTDTEPPTITVPADIVVNATSPAGLAVSYTASAVDDVDGPVAVACSPPSGSVFPIGTTEVVCTASDTAGNEASAGFQVQVKGASEQLDDLISHVEDLGAGTSLADKLTEAMAALDAGDEVAACKKLAAFLNAVAAQSGKKLTPAQAAELLASANQIRAVLAC